MQNISKISASEVRGSGMHRKQNFKVLGFKNDASVSTLHFAFSFAFLAFALFFLVGKVFGKGFRIVGLDEESFFLGIFGSRLHFLLLSPDFLTESTSGLKNLFPLLNCSS